MTIISYSYLRQRLICKGLFSRARHGFEQVSKSLFEGDREQNKIGNNVRQSYSLSQYGVPSPPNAGGRDPNAGQQPTQYRNYFTQQGPRGYPQNMVPRGSAAFPHQRPPPGQFPQGQQHPMQSQWRPDGQQMRQNGGEIGHVNGAPGAYSSYPPRSLQQQQQQQLQHQQQPQRPASHGESEAERDGRSALPPYPPQLHDQRQPPTAPVERYELHRHTNRYPPPPQMSGQQYSGYPPVQERPQTEQNRQDSENFHNNKLPPERDPWNHLGFTEGF